MLLTYCKNAVRQLAQTPGFTLAALVMLVLGIGMTTAVFSIVEGVLLRPLPFKDPGRLVKLSDQIRGVEDVGGRVTGPDIVAYARGMHSFQAFGGYQTVSYELSGAGEPKQINAARLSPGVLAALGLAPTIGRVFTKAEDEGGQPVTILSDGLWADRFRRDPKILGTEVLLDRKPYVVIGVMPRSFEFPLNPGRLNRSELWIPLSLRPEELTAAAANWTFDTVGRLKPGVTSAQAQVEAHRIAGEIMRAYPSFMSSLRIEPQIRGLQEATVEQTRPLLRILSLAVLVVLLLVALI